MSRVGKKPIPIPEGIEINVEDGRVLVRGPKGELTVPFRPEVHVIPENNMIKVICQRQDKYARSLHGLTRSLIANAVVGVNQGFEKRLEIIGVGYRAELDGRRLRLMLGFSHPIVFPAPEGIEFAVEGSTKIIIRGIDKQEVGQTAARIRSFRPPEPYKGRGIRYEGEVIRRKAGKTAG